jgi:hypothetical protein
MLAPNIMAMEIIPPMRDDLVSKIFISLAYSKINIKL